MAFYAANRIKVTTTTTGTDDFGIGSATSLAFQDFATAGVPDGSTVHYTAYTADQFECGEGTYDEGGLLLTRDTISASSNSGLIETFSSSPTLIVGPLAETFLEQLQTTTGTIFVEPTGDGTTDTANVQTAIDLAATLGRRTVKLGRGLFTFLDTILIENDNIWIVGSGMDKNDPDNGTRCGFAISSTSPGFNFERASGQLSGWGLTDLTIQYFGNSSPLVQIGPSRNGTMERINLVIGASTSAVGVLLDATTNNVQNCTFKELHFFMNSSAASGVMLQLTGATTTNVFNCSFDTLVMQGNAATQTLIKIGSSDNNFFSNVSAASASNVALCCINFDYSESGGGWPVENVIVGYNSGFGISKTSNNFTNTGTPSAGIQPNCIYGFALTNGMSPPVLENLRVETALDGRAQTYTPTITGGSSNPTITYTTQLGRYIQTGQLINFWMRIVPNSYSGGSGNAQFRLPVASASLGANIGSCQVYTTGVDWPNAIPIGVITNNAQICTIHGLTDNGSNSVLQVGDIASGDVIVINGSYIGAV